MEGWRQKGKVSMFPSASNRVANAVGIPYGFCHCGCGGKTSTIKQTSKKIGNIKGEPRKFINYHAHREPITERFWKYVEKNGPVVRPELGPCWKWIGKTNEHGYGLLGDQRTKKGGFTRAHRISHEIHLGIIPKGLLVLHKCDNKTCVNPDHLYTGNHKNNADDAVERRRLPLGEDTVMAKLTAAQVEEIRSKYRYQEVVIQRLMDEDGNITTLQKLADKYGVNGTTIFQIVHGRSWKHMLPKQETEMEIKCQV